MANTLSFWHEYLDQAADADTFAWGDVKRRSSADLAFRVRNNSSVYTAVDVTLTLADEGTTATPSVAAQHLLSTDKRRFTASVNLGDLYPGSVSDVVTLRRVTASDADLGTFSFNLIAETTWS